MDEPAEPDPPTDQRKARKRANDKELLERTEIVRRKLLTGETPKSIHRLILEEWGVKKSQGYSYIKRAEAEIKEAAARSRDDWLAEHIAHRRDMRRRANDALDYRAELAAAESEAKLLGLDAPTKLEHSGPGGGPMENKHSGSVTLTAKLDIYTAAFAAAADREEAGSPPGDGTG